jgi:hypothetical protein
MRFVQHAKLPIIAATLLLGPSFVFGATHHKKPSAKVNVRPYDGKSHKGSHHAGAQKRKQHSRGQMAIDKERAQQIQNALLREHYLGVEPSGSWDASTQEAMRRYQADQGWQTKTVPDSRALIRLGLGPNHDHLLNPESAMVSGPPSLRPAHTSPEAGSSSRSAILPAPSSAPSSSPLSMAPNLSSAR